MLVDSDIFIDLFRGVNSAQYFFLDHTDSIIFSAITEAELLSGNVCKDPREEERVLHFLAQFEKIPVDNPLVQRAGKLRRELQIGMPDAIIAATALARHTKLITRNIKDFKKIPELEIESPY